MQLQPLPKRRYPPPPPPSEHVPDGMAMSMFAAMGTTVQVIVPFRYASTAAQLVEQLFGQWEQKLSRFLPKSELSFLNQHTGSYVPVSELTYDVIAAAVTAAQATDGIYDPSLLVQMHQAGYDRSFDALLPQQPESVATAVPGGAWRSIVLVPDGHAVYVPPGKFIDLGGIAKGMAVDAALSLLRERHLDAALVNAGGDLGVFGLPPGMDHWPVAVPDGSVIRLERGALATSGKTHRHWRQGLQERHHIIDPRTGTPAQTEVQTATVTADRCTQAEVAAKVAFILGAESGLAFLRHHRVQGMLSLDDGSVVATPGWPPTHPLSRTT